MKRPPVILLLVICLLGLLLPSAQAVDPYSHTNSKGRTYYLFSKDVPLKNSDRVQTIYFFARDPANPKGDPVAAVPEGKMVSETKTGLLVLKRKPEEPPKPEPPKAD